MNSEIAWFEQHVRGLAYTPEVPPAASDTGALPNP
jgi:hypothetical protein